MDPVDPHVHVVARRQVPAPERLVLLVPARRQPRNVRRAQPRRVLAQQHRQRLPEVARRQPPQIQDRQHLGHLRRTSHVRRQNPTREPLPLAFLVHPTVVHARGADLHRSPLRRSPSAPAHDRSEPPGGGHRRPAPPRAPRHTAPPPPARPFSSMRRAPSRAIASSVGTSSASTALRLSPAPASSTFSMGGVSLPPACQPGCVFGSPGRIRHLPHIPRSTTLGNTSLEQRENVIRGSVLARLRLRPTRHVDLGAVCGWSRTPAAAPSAA